MPGNQHRRPTARDPLRAPAPGAAAGRGIGIRDRRAAALAAVLAVLGSLTVALGLRTEDSAPPPAALAAAPASPAPGRASSAAAQAAAAPGPVSSAGAPSTAETAGRTGSAPAEGEDGGAGPAAGMAPSVPVGLDIAAIGVRTSIMPLGLHADGTLQVPPLRGDAPAGWYRHSPTPGEVGASVLAGHVDTARDGPAVFHRLHELRPGDPIAVRRTDGTVARFSVARVAVYPKREFPSQEVYAPLRHAGLRLITCGGVFDRGEGSYRSNVVVFADAVR